SATLAVNACVSSDFHSQGIKLNDELPFNITSSNTIFLLNCSNSMLHLQPTVDCSPTSICHSYIKENAVACMGAPFCCTFKIGGFPNAQLIKVYDGGCAAYQSFVNMDLKMVAVKKWPEPGLEIEWAAPREPVCKIPLDCKDLLYSECLADPMSFEQRRCLRN